MQERNRIFSPQGLSEYMGIAVHTLALYRLYGTGPKYLKLGHIVRYKLGDVLDWIDQKSEENAHA
jgi:predicted DNA-binding transcriptional regulator AlpA